MRILEAQGELREELGDLCGCFVGELAEERLEQIFEVHGRLRGRGCRAGALVLVFFVPAEALAFNDDGFGVVQQSIEERRGECTVVVEDLDPRLVRSIGGEYDRSTLVALADDLEEQIGAALVDREVSELVN